MKKLERHIFAMELAMYMAGEGRTFEQAWKEKTLQIN